MLLVATAMVYHIPIFFILNSCTGLGQGHLEDENSGSQDTTPVKETLRTNKRTLYYTPYQRSSIITMLMLVRMYMPAFHRLVRDVYCTS